MAFRKKRMIDYELYMLKRNKQPDHLLKLLQKTHKENQFEQLSLEEDVTRCTRKQLVEKRVKNILSHSPSNTNTISKASPYLKKKWEPPIAQNVDNKEVELADFWRKTKVSADQREKFSELLNVLDLNKKMKYFGDFLQSDYDGQERNPVKPSATKESKLAELEKKYKKLDRKATPKLCVFSKNQERKLKFINYLEDDEFFKKIMRKDDIKIVELLIEALEFNGHFSFTSFLTFYDIFVWQTAQKLDQIAFVCRLLMGKHNKMPLETVSNRIDFICKRINLQSMSKQMQNFGEIMKKLLFGENYVHVGEEDYELKREQLIESLLTNEECISIFINIFYSG